MTQLTKKIPKADTPPVNQMRFMIFARLPSYHEIEPSPSDNLFERRAKRKARKGYQELFYYAIKEGFGLASYYHPENMSYFKGKVRVDLVIHNESKRHRDEDNYLYSAGKLIIEQLFGTKRRYPAVNLIVDDREEYLKWGEITFKLGSPMVEVTLTEID